MELRDAHAKLRTSNEKMRRERERCNKECDELRGAMAMRKHSELNEVKCLSALMEQIDDIVKFFPDLHKHAEAQPYTPTPPRRVRVRKFFFALKLIDVRIESFKVPVCTK